MITDARAVASYGSDALVTPSLRSQILWPDYRGSEKGPMMASAGSSWSGVGRAGVAG